MEKDNTGSLWDANWDSRNPGEADRITLFNKKSPQNLIQFWQKGYYLDLQKLLPENKNIKMLEMGCGRATTSMYLVNNQYADVTLLDFSARALDMAIKNFEEEGLPKPKVICGDATDSKLPSNEFDCIYNIGLLEHFKDPLPVIREAYRLLKPGGFIFMPIVPAMPYKKSLPLRLALAPFSVAIPWVKKKLAKKKKQQTNAVDTGIERTAYGSDYYEQLCDQAGFSKIDCLPYNPYWRINRSKFFEKWLTLPVYKIHYKLFRSNKKIALESNDNRNLCLLLVAYK